MRIVDRKTFMALPPGTVFLKYKPCHFGELSVKHGNCGEDFVVAELAAPIEASGTDEFVDLLDEARESPNLSLNLDFNITGRDGCYNQEQLFAVYEKKDVEGLMEKLKQCLTEGYPT